jgi:hypothetical protein
MVKWLKSFIEVAAEVECNNRYSCIDYNMNNIVNYVLELGYNPSRFDMNFMINILHDPPNHHVESIIGNLIYFKQVTVRIADGTYLKFLDAMNYAPLQTVPFEQKDLLNLKNSIINLDEYKAYLVDWEEKGFQTRWDSLKYYNINDVIIMISPIDNLIAMFFKWGWIYCEI